MKIICLLLVLSIATPALAVGTYEDTTYSLWGITNPYVSATDLRLERINGAAVRDVGDTISGHTADVRGRARKNKAWDIGSYESWEDIYPPLAEYGFPELPDPLEVYKP